jgi:hypothetical protein
MKSRCVQIEFPEKSFARLARLKTLTQAESHGEVIKNALRLYEFTIDKSSRGATFLLHEEGKSPETIQLFKGEGS